MSREADIILRRRRERKRYSERIKADRRKLGLTAHGTPLRNPNHPLRITALQRDSDPAHIQAREPLYNLKNPAKGGMVDVAEPIHRPDRTDDELDRTARQWLDKIPNHAV